MENSESDIHTKTRHGDKYISEIFLTYQLNIVYAEGQEESDAWQVAGWRRVKPEKKSVCAQVWYIY